MHGPMYHHTKFAKYWYPDVGTFPFPSSHNTPLPSDFGETASKSPRPVVKGYDVPRRYAPPCSPRTNEAGTAATIEVRVHRELFRVVIVVYKMMRLINSTHRGQRWQQTKMPISCEQTVYKTYEYEYTITRRLELYHHRAHLDWRRGPKPRRVR